MMMAKYPKLTALALLTCFCFFRLQAQGYEIKIKIASYPGNNVIMAHHFANNTSLYPDDTVKLDAKGVGIFKGKKALPGGMYLIYLPDKKSYFDILIDKQQKFSIEADTTNFIKTTKFSGSPENEIFYQYQNYLSSKREQANALVEKRKTAKADEKISIEKSLDEITKDVKSYTEKVIASNPNTFLGTFLKSLQEINVPDAPRDAKGVITDSLFQARYFKAHYFDNFDYADPSLLRTPMYEQKVKTYFEKAIWQIPDTIINEVDMVLKKVKSNDELFRYNLVTLYNLYASSQIMGMDAVFVHIADQYYLPYATWSDSAFREKLKKEVAHKKPNLIGKIAPNVKLVQLPADHFIAAKSDTALKSNPYIGNNMNISDIKSKFLVIAFWEADCGHCKKVIPLLNDSMYPIIKAKGAEVLAVHILSSVEGKRKWIDFVNEHNLYNWINAWSPYSLEYKELYDIYSTPVIYVLDENKKIIAKRIDIKQIESVIDFETRRLKEKADKQ
jgi:thiol-disulfide isomerase/thioredoxin